MFCCNPSLALTASLLLPVSLPAQASQPIQAQQQPTEKVLTLPTGATIPIHLSSAIDTKIAKAGDSFEGRVAANVYAGGFVALPIGTPVIGRVVTAKAAGRLGNAAVLSLELVSVQPNGQTVGIATRQLSGNNGRGSSSAPLNGNAALGTLIAGGQQIVVSTEALLQFQTTAIVQVAAQAGPAPAAIGVHANTNPSPQPGIIPNQSDPYTFDIVGLRLGMTAQQASTALHAKVPQVTILAPAHGAPQFTPTARFTGNLTANGPKFSVLMTFTETYPFDPQRPEQLTGIFYTASLTTAADRENFEQAVLSKYGPPVRSTKGVGAGWCNIGILNGPTGYVCAPDVPNLVFRSDELILGDPGVVVKERAAWNRQTS